MKPTRLLGTLMFVLLILGMVTSIARAQKGKPKPPPTISDPAIAYSYPRAKQFDLMVMSADGSNPTPVVSESLTDNTAPDWSPDGTSLVFNRLERKTGQGKICTKNLGSTVPLSCADRATNSRPAWSPIKFGVEPNKMYKIAFTSMVLKEDGGRDSELFLADYDGTNFFPSTQLTKTDDINEGDVDWSPTGDRLAVGTYDGARSDIKIYQIDCTASPCTAYELSNLIQVTGSPLE
ncbi:MAG: TolB family protein, partial [Deltaproteobacteria bacterium]